MITKSFPYLVLAGFLLSFQVAFAQPWMNNINLADTNTTFYDIQTEFENYWVNRPIEKGKGWKQFKRWENFMVPRVYPTGKFFNPQQSWNEYQQWQQTYGGGFQTQATANWQPMGPTNAIPTNGGGMGRLACIEFMPGNNQIIFVGAPAGGLWKSTNYGASWTPLTDQLPTLGISDVAINTANTLEMYIATGDRDAADTYSVGVLKSTDGGNTWNTTGLNWNITQTRTVNRLLMHPTNPQILIAAASNGIWRTTNGGTNWTQVQTSGDHKSLDFSPTNPDTVYASSSGTIRRSIDNGATWSTAATVSGVNRIALAVTPANPNYVYALCSKSSDNGFHSLRRSSDRGATWTVQSTSPNVLGWNTTGTDAGGQGWYDLYVAASPTNANWIIIGGVNQWHSTNGGTSWTMNSHWYGGGGKPYVHADVHGVRFEPGSGSIIYSLNDGGLFRTTNSGTAWSDISAGLAVSMLYDISQNVSNATNVWAGFQDNGTNRLQSGTWSQRIGGDGMITIVDHTTPSIVYGSLYYGDINKSVNSGGSFTQVAGQGVNGITETGGWVTPYIMDPTNNNILYAGYDNVWRTNNAGAAWSISHSLSGGSGKLVALGMSANDNTVLYSAKSDRMWRNTTNITAGLPTGSASITCIKVDPANKDRVWVTFSGFSAANKIFRTTDGGNTWVNITYNLPNLPCNTVEYIPGTTEEIYLGTDVGVYVFDPATTSWSAFNTGLPNVIIKDLEFHVASGKLRAGTYGRGLWETDLVVTPLPPIADFVASSTSICVGGSVTFTDISTNSPTSWQWTFTGGTPATSTTQNPTVTYAAPGVYDVELIAINGQGQDTMLRTAHITVGSGGSPLPLIEDFESNQFSTNGWNITNPDNNLTWEILTTSGNTSGTHSARVNTWNYNAVGERDGMASKVLDFSQYNSVNLAFKHSYRRSSTGDTDSLLVRISTDCGVTFTDVVFQRGSQPFATNTITNTDYVPSTTNDWCLNGTYDTCYQNIDLSAYIPSTTVVVKFETYCDYGGNIYVDDINITGVSNQAPPVADFTASQTLICPGQTINFTDISTNTPTSWSWSFGAGASPSNSFSQNPVVTYNTPGTYTVSLTVTNPGGNDTRTYNNLIVVGGGVTAGINTPTTTVICGAGSILLSSTTVGTGYQWMLNGVNIFGATASSYNATASGNYDLILFSNGCPDTTTIPVILSIASGLTANIVATPPAICGTFATLLTGSGGGNYQWMLNGVAIPGQTNSTYWALTPGSYHLEVSSSGCTDTTNAPTVLQTYPQPQAGFTYVVNNGLVTFTDISVGATNYAWSFGDGGNSILQNTTNIYLTAGSYTVTQIVSNGPCADTISHVVNIITTKADSELTEQEFEVFPNPNPGMFTVRLDIGDESTVRVILTNSLAQEIYSKTVPSKGDQLIDINDLPAGTYFLRVIAGNRTSERKVVRQ